MESMIDHFIRPEIFAVWSKSSDIRYKSTSGGAFTELAKIIISKGGGVAGAQYDKNCRVEHGFADNFNDLEKLRQSKYVQSDLKNIYVEVEAELKNGKLIGFCGAPCQVAGLYAYLGKDYSNLITMDFICRGMNSPKAYASWLKEIEMKEGSKPIKIWFKYKKGGWKSSPTRTRVDFEDGHSKVYYEEKNLFMYGYLTSNLYIKPCCGKCRFKNLPRYGDISFADFWGIDEKYDDDKGTSLLLINSVKGKNLFDEAKEQMVYFRRNFESILAENPMFNTSVDIPKAAPFFLADLDYLGFTEALKKYGSYPSKKVILKRIASNYIQKVKRIIR